MEHRLADGDLVVAVPASSGGGGGPTQPSPPTVVTVVPLGTQDAAFAGADWAWHANTGYVIAGSSGGGGSAECGGAVLRVTHAMVTKGENSETVVSLGLQHQKASATAAAAAAAAATAVNASGGGGGGELQQRAVRAGSAHGQFQGACYITIPGIRREQMPAAAAAAQAVNTTVVLANTAAAQAVLDRARHQALLTFWRPGNVSVPAGGVTDGALAIGADRPSVVLVALENQLTLTVTVADPTNNPDGGNVRVTLSFAGLVGTGCTQSGPFGDGGTVFTLVLPTGYDAGRSVQLSCDMPLPSRRP